MLRAEAMRVSLFLILLIAVFVSAAALGLKVPFRRLRGREPSLTPEGRLARWVVFGLAALGTLCIAYGYFVEPYWLSVTHVRLESPKLGRGERQGGCAPRPVRIAFLADLVRDTWL